ncbi:hypothetical protein CAPTEDRAFT_5213 [Capitella teleta]|uniref:Uncharacterized protein n=1 Tax=Capitella teleta TaxID=283909 RepID=R7TZ26_CAPTE|nr:hypothetical protein CAPTEDRAFT_5213 [Capitella teleta]|eukprot:ELT96200.1 hypothetical protein CAPTEDRAFT_5213 [Capitella teleta]
MEYECIAYCCVFYLLLKGIEWLLRKPHISRRAAKCVFITGCDSGFGHETAKILTRYGITVFAGCYTDLGMKILQEYNAINLKPVRIDVSNKKSITEAVQWVKGQLPEGKGLWGLVNNAGIPGSHIGPMDWLTLDDHREVFDVNYFGLVAVTEAFLPLLKKEKGSRIVNTASILGRMTMMFSGSYTATKHAVEGYSAVLRNEIRPFDISVHIVEPTVIFTPIADETRLLSAAKRAWNRLEDDKKNQYGEKYLEQMQTVAFANYYKMGSPDLTPVLDAYEHALFSWWPKRRYLVGVNSTTFWLMMVLPDVITDFLSNMSTPLVPAIMNKK